MYLCLALRSFLVPGAHSKRLHTKSKTSIKLFGSKFNIEQNAFAYAYLLRTSLAKARAVATRSPSAQSYFFAAPPPR